VTGFDRDTQSAERVDAVFNEDEADTADDAGVQLLWDWWADVGGGKTTTVPEDVRRDAQRRGFAFDSFAPVLAEAARLADYLDQHGDAGGLK